MKINLSSNWFAPDGALLRTSRNPHSVPDKWEKLLPPHTEVVGAKVDEDESEAEKPAPTKPTSK